MVNLLITIIFQKRCPIETVRFRLQSTSYKLRPAGKQLEIKLSCHQFRYHLQAVHSISFIGKRQKRTSSLKFDQKASFCRSSKQVYLSFEQLTPKKIWKFKKVLLSVLADRINSLVLFQVELNLSHSL